VGCTVGVLPEEMQVRNGCLQESGTLDIEGIGSVDYTYSVADDNKNGRSFGGWSETADSTLGNEKFEKYYGQADYINEWVTAAFEGRATNFPGLGGADFSTYGYDGRNQVIMKGTAYMSSPMITIRHLESALDYCLASDMDAAKHSWDEAVAFYTGSWALGSPGILMYALSEKRCKNFKACGRKADELEGTSYVNLELFDIFNDGQIQLGMEGTEHCGPLRDLIDRASALMSIGQIQGTLRYGYKVSSGSDSETAMSEGAVFAAGVLPRVHACSEADAQTIYDNMKVGAESTDFQKVLTAFENNYECMGLAAWEIGRLVDDDGNEIDAIYAEDVIESVEEDVDEPMEEDAIESVEDVKGSLEDADVSRSVIDEIINFISSLFENGGD